MSKRIPTVPTMTALATYQPKGGNRIGSCVRVRSVDTVFRVSHAEGRTPDGINLVAVPGARNKLFASVGFQAETITGGPMPTNFEVSTTTCDSCGIYRPCVKIKLPFLMRHATAVVGICGACIGPAHAFVEADRAQRLGRPRLDADHLRRERRD